MTVASTPPASTVSTRKNTCCNCCVLVTSTTTQHPAAMCSRVSRRIRGLPSHIDDRLSSTPARGTG